MKKITLSVAFLLFGGVYIANAQVGIGTPTPAASSMLDIKADDKGVLIPRVKLSKTTEFSPIDGAQVESLLVYNDAVPVNDVTPGFYYWTPINTKVTPNVPAHWERIVNQTQLDQVINKVGDIDKILALLKKAFPSNNLVNPSTNGDTHGGGMVYTPGNGTTTQPKIEYVYFDGTNYVTKDITADIVNLIKGAESKTTILEFPADSGKFYYISEETMQASNGTTALTTPFKTDGTTLQAGVVFLDIPESVIKNFETILDGTTTIVKPGTTNQFFTVEEYIQYLSSTVEGNVIYKNIAAAGDPANFVFQYWDGTTYQTIDLGDIVAANETKTFFREVVLANGNTQYIYFSEEAIQNWLKANATNTIANIPDNAPGVVVIDATSDVVQNFENILNQTTQYNGDTVTIEEIINEIAGKIDGNVIYKNIAAAGDPANFVFQYWDGTTYQTIDLGDIVAANETKTFFREVVLANGNTQYIYFSEEAIQNWLKANATNTIANIPDNAPGVVVIDATSDVVQNFENILNQTTQYNGDTVTIEEIINEIAGKIDGNVIYKNIAAAGDPANFVFQYWDGTTYQTIDLGDIVKANESKTLLFTSTDKKTQFYISEAYLSNKANPAVTQAIVNGWAAGLVATPVVSLPAGVYQIEVVDGVVKNIETILKEETTILKPGSTNDYYTVEEYIQYISSITDGNVIYRNIGTVAAPNFVFQYWDSTANNGDGEYVTITLGNTIVTGTTAVKTKDTLDAKAIYIYSTTTTTNGVDATTTGVTLPTNASIGKIISITVTNAAGVASSVTDVSLTKVTGKLSFNIGTGMLYSVLPADTYNVIIEFAAQ